MSRWKLLSVALALVVLAAGCEEGADYSSLGLVDVSGKVTLDGQPLAGVTVRFEGPTNRFADGVTDGSGNYVLRYDSDKNGCLPGEKVVRIMPGAVGEGAEEPSPIEGPDGKVTAVSVDTLPAVYNKQSTLTANVSPENMTFNFDLKSNP